MILNQFLTLFVLILFSAIFSGTETALISLTPSKVDELVAINMRNSLTLKKIKSNPHRLLITVLIGNNIVNISASAYSALIFTNLFGSSGLGIATGVMTFFILVFGEITPKSFAHQHSAGVSLLMAKPLLWLEYILWPLIWIFESIVKITNKFFGSKNAYSVTEGEILAMLKIGAQEGSIAKHEKEFIENVFEFNDIEADEIMTPRVNVESMDGEMTIAEAIEFMIKRTHSRYPVYKKNLDNVIGILTTKELFKFSEKFGRKKRLKDLPLREPILIPLSRKIYSLFRDFQKTHEHMAIVVGDYGGTAGIVTLEDILEEIVGEIADESDPKQHLMKALDNNTLVVSGVVAVEDVSDFFNVEISKDHKHYTIHTYLVDNIHRFPREGEIIKLKSFSFQVLKMKNKLVESVKIKKLKES